MRDSEPDVKATALQWPSADSDSLNRNSCNALNVPDKAPTNRDTVLSDFVRVKIREWIDAGREQQALAELAGLKPSAIAMIKKGQGVGAKSAPKLATALGFSSTDAMIDAAYAWRQEKGDSIERRLGDQAFQAGLAAASLFMVPPTDAEIRSIATDFVAPRFDNREPQWWSTTIGTELVLDRARSVDPAQRGVEERILLHRKNAYRDAAGMTKREAQAAAYTAKVRAERAPELSPVAPAIVDVTAPVKKRRAR